MVASRPFRPANREASAVLAELAELWDQAAARLAAEGELPLTQKRLAAESRVAESTLSSWSTGGSLPQDPDQLVAVGGVLSRWAEREPARPREWLRLLEADRAARSTPGSPASPGRLIAGLDPFALEVHRPVIPDSGSAGLPPLPPYVRRPHDEDLAAVVGRAAEGRSGISVLVGGSSTGKTRACWEAVQALPGGWRLWHPFDPTRPEAALGDLARVGPRTVVWLNETQLYLDTASDTGERVAAALTTLLTDSARGPVLVLGTLWPKHWDVLTREDNSHPQARFLLAGADVRVPDAFTGPALDQLRVAAAQDPRLAAAADAPDGQVTQFVAGAPVLLARYRNAPPFARAVIEAAMDARRLGHGLALPHALLENAGPAYLTDTEWACSDEDWLEQALAYTAAPCKGTAGPLTRIRPRPGAPGPGDAGAGPAYRLADYLEQHGRSHRADIIPPDGFWVGARYTSPLDQVPLALAARDRGLYRHAAQLFKDAAARAHLPAPRLVALMAFISPADRRPAQFAVSCASLDDPGTVAWLLEALREAGASDQTAALLARDPAAHAALEDTDGVAMLLDALQKAGASDQTAALLARDPAAHASLEHEWRASRLLDALQKAGARDQVTVLAARVLERRPLSGAGALSAILQRAGAADQADAVLTYAALYTPVESAGGVAWQLKELRETGASEQATALLARDPAMHVCIDEPWDVAQLLRELRQAGATDQAAALATRAARTPRLRIRRAWPRYSRPSRRRAPATRPPPCSPAIPPLTSPWNIRIPQPSC